MRRPFRAAVAGCTVVALFLAACSGPVVVAKRDLAPETEWEGLYRVTTKSDQFVTLHFSIEDSSLVIRELGGKDKHYVTATLPIAIPLSEVISVERLKGHETDKAIAIACLSAVGLFFAALIVVASWDDE